MKRNHKQSPIRSWVNFTNEPIKNKGKISKKKTPSKPPNSFLLFRIEKYREIAAKNEGISNSEVSKVVGRMWNDSSSEEKEPYRKLAKEKKIEFDIKRGSTSSTNEPGNLRNKNLTLVSTNAVEQQSSVASMNKDDLESSIITFFPYSTLNDNTNLISSTLDDTHNTTDSSSLTCNIDEFDDSVEENATIPLSSEVTLASPSLISSSSGSPSTEGFNCWTDFETSEQLTQTLGSSFSTFNNNGFRELQMQAPLEWAGENICSSTNIKNSTNNSSREYQQLETFDLDGENTSSSPHINGSYLSMFESDDSEAAVTSNVLDNNTFGVTNLTGYANATQNSTSSLRSFQPDQRPLGYIIENGLLIWYY
ncbi:12841_t:CDS:2 [Acaulospora morrowiae]|uniref:12841_t:CDS:1 n=1 Tax=Acaulospora morrowiae TaxID=94023 RepID=A0A9N9CB12_9GLOM|nr:12841_t:CDS:2 [Acaulospora morrowiae]